MSSLNGEQIALPQPGDKDVTLCVFGDEFYARYETTDGFTAVLDPVLNRYCYASELDGKLISMGIPVTQPHPAGLRRHLREAPQVRNSIFERNHKRRRPPVPMSMRNDTVLTLGPNQGLLEGQTRSLGSVRGLTVLVDFADVKTSVTKADVDELMNGNNYNKNGNFCSVRAYFDLVSAGALDYSNVVVGPIRLSHTRSYYADNLMVGEVLHAVAALGIDFKQFDGARRGIIDAINILYAGPSVFDRELWPHNAVFNAQLGTVQSQYYQLSGLGQSAEDLRVGTICHENGHMLCRFPDLYDYGQRDGDFQASSGLGSYCLMSAGNHLDDGRTPAPVCGYLRNLAGWCTNVVELNAGGVFKATHGDYATLMMYRSGLNNEYFIVENRSHLGLDSHCPSEGLAVYHCDILGSNEWEDGSPARHYQIALLQADGRGDLERNINRGDASDLFKANAAIVLSHSTVPSSLRWDLVESGLEIGTIGSPGATIQFSVTPKVKTEFSAADLVALVREKAISVPVPA